MTNSSIDLSGKIDKTTVDALGLIHRISSSLSIAFFVVGATARDILLDVFYGIGSKRATMDIDIAVFVEDWNQFKRLKNELIATADFSSTRETQRLLFKNRLPVDLVPFGGVAEKEDMIGWPPDNSFRMNVAGFRECYQHVVQVQISVDPDLTINVANLAGLAILKLISWDENSARRRKDASDLLFILQNYLDAGNLERLFDEAPDIVDSGDYNYEAGSARLLGRDISAIAFATTKAKLIAILTRESQRKQGHSIAMDALQGNRFSEKSYEEISALFDSLLKGLMDADVKEDKK